jgi:hypothetical protein
MARTLFAQLRQAGYRYIYQYLINETLNVILITLNYYSPGDDICAESTVSQCPAGLRSFLAPPFVVPTMEHAAVNNASLFGITWTIHIWPLHQAGSNQSRPHG